MQAASRRPGLPTADERRARLEDLKALVLDNRAAISAAISADFGARSAVETNLLEVVPLMASLAHARRHLGRWMRDERRPVDLKFQPSRAWVRHEPLGKSPAILAADYPIDKAARSIAFGKFINAGQTCIAPDYVLVPADRAEAFARSVLDQAVRAYPTVQDNDDYSGIISERHRARLREAVAAARAAGATVLDHADAAADGGKIAPTVVLNPPGDSLLMQEEIFGPVLPVIGYRSLDEALAFVAARSRPLALYVFTHDGRTRKRILDATPSGGVTLNGTMLHIAQNDLPFGGVGASGMGAYHGHAGFRRFSHARAVYDVGPVNAFERLGPPWGALARTAVRFLSR